MNVLALCAGAGGIELGLRLAFPAAHAVCYVEREAYIAARLASRMEEGHLPPAPIHSDLFAFDGGEWRGVVDLVTAGFPCQPFSHAGLRRGDQDERWLWDEVLRVLVECGAPLLFFENVRGLASKGLGKILGQLACLGFSAECDVFSAEEEGAPHRRERIFLLAHHGRGGRVRHLLEQAGGARPLHDREDGRVARQDTAPHACREQERTQREPRSGGPKAEPREHGQDGRVAGPTLGPNAAEQRLEAERRRAEASRRPEPEPHGAHRSVAGPGAGADAEGRERRLPAEAGHGLPNARGNGERGHLAGLRGLGGRGGWAAEPALGRVAHGVADRVDRLRACGNGVVPAVAARAWRELAGRALA